MTTLPPEDARPADETPETNSSAPGSGDAESVDAVPAQAAAEAPDDAAAQGDGLPVGDPTAQPSYAPPQAPAGFEQPPFGAPTPPPPYGAPQQPFGAPQPPPGYAPQAPGFGAPQQPGYGAPQQPGYGAPQQPGYGAPQGYYQPQNGATNPLSNLTANYWLSVFFFWIPALIFFLVESPKSSPQVRALHAANLNFALLRTALLIFGWIFAVIPVLGPLLVGVAHLAGFVLHIIAATKVAETYRQGGTDPFLFNAPMVR